MMDQHKFDDHMKRIEEFVIDETAIVTYKWLSRQFNVNVNTAKQLLYSFKSTHGKSYGAEISSTYLISGVKQDGSQVISLVNEPDLPEARQALVDVLSEHVYSVQKIKAVDDLQLLYAVDQLKDTSSFDESPITCSVCVPKSESELASKPVRQVPVVEPKAAKPVKPCPRSPKTEPKCTKEEKEEDVKPEEAVKEVTKKITNVKIDASKEKKKGHSISSMFSAQNQKAKAGVKKVEPPWEEPARPTPVVDDVEIVEKAEKMVEPKKTSKKDEETKKAEKAKSKRKTKAKATDDLKEKKRKRIQVFSDSDNSDADEPKERSPSPEPEPEPEVQVESEEEEEKGKASVSGQPATHKRKKRRVVDKLVMTEEGYMETTKEVVFESDSEPEPEAVKPAPSEKKTPEAKNPSPSNKSASPKKPTSPKKGKGKAALSDGRKQSSLLSFFKKT